MKGIKVFKVSGGKKPFSQWLNRIKDKRDRARIRRRIDRLALGNYGDYKKLSKDLFELRLFFGPGYRVYFTEINDEIVILLMGGDKKTQKKDIDKAKDYLQTLLTGDQNNESHL